MVTRIAMWSGPRNISTAMMRAFENRPDAHVCDEPFYACYLRATNADHPGRTTVIQADQASPDDVAASLLAPLPDAIDVFYQKHMAHHMIEGMPLDWIDQVTSCFLIREPREVITSFARVIPNPTMQDVGFERQVELFELVRERTGRTPPVIDSRTVLEHPRAALTRLCEALDIPFTERMLAWAPGPRPTDGPWAPFWYENVERSTGFGPYRPKTETVPPHLTGLLDACTPMYAHLAREAL